MNKPQVRVFYKGTPEEIEKNVNKFVEKLQCSSVKIQTHYGFSTTTIPVKPKGNISQPGALEIAVQSMYGLMIAVIWTK